MKHFPIILAVLAAFSVAPVAAKTIEVEIEVPTGDSDLARGANSGTVFTGGKLYKASALPTNNGCGQFKHFDVSAGLLAQLAGAGKCDKGGRPDGSRTEIVEIEVDG